MRRFYVSKFDASGMPVISGAEAHHLRKVLRLKVGDCVALFDDQGNQFETVIAAFADEYVKVSVIRRIPASTQPPTRLVVAQGFLKERKMDKLVRPLTELGVSHWIPFFAVRCVALPNGKRLDARRRRWEKLMHESMKQCGRNRPMAIEPPLDLAGALAMAAGSDLKLILYEKMRNSLEDVLEERSITSGGLFIMLGPEGGFTAGEVQQAVDHGFNPTGLGPRTLRSETATLAACAILQYRFGDMGKKALDKQHEV
jgi:16S rRNA (uracil1498-N3)-methyltransferase